MSKTKRCHQPECREATEISDLNSFFVSIEEENKKKKKNRMKKMFDEKCDFLNLNSFRGFFFFAFLFWNFTRSEKIQTWNRYRHSKQSENMSRANAWNWMKIRRRHETHKTSENCWSEIVYRIRLFASLRQCRDKKKNARERNLWVFTHAVCCRWRLLLLRPLFSMHSIRCGEQRCFFVSFLSSFRSLLAMETVEAIWRGKTDMHLCTIICECDSRSDYHLMRYFSVFIFVLF